MGNIGGYPTPMPHRRQNRGNVDRRVERSTLHIGLEVMQEQPVLEKALEHFAQRMPTGSFAPMGPDNLHVTLAGSSAALRGLDGRRDVREGQINAIEHDLREAAAQLGYIGCSLYVDPRKEVDLLGIHRDAVAVPLLDDRPPKHTIGTLRGLADEYVRDAAATRGHEIDPLNMPPLHMTIGHVNYANLLPQERADFAHDPLTFVNRCRDDRRHPVAHGLDLASRVILPEIVELGQIVVSEVRL